MALDLDPIKFAETYFTLKGHPFKIKGTHRDYLDRIYYTIVFKVPKTHQPVVVVKGRQVEMSTTITNIVMYFLHGYPHFSTLYTFPGVELARRFNSQKIEPIFRYKTDEEILKPLKNGTWNISQKQFTNGSELLLYGIAESGDNIRNISADMLVKDEYQDLDQISEGVADEVLTHSDYKVNISLGTPKFSETVFESVWKKSTQEYYHLQCPICKHWFVLGMDSLVEGHTIKCPSCGNKEDKRNLLPTGKWIALNPRASRIGFHLSQLYVPYLTKEDILRKIEDEEARGSDVKRYIQNEILGEFYSGVRQKPTWEAIKEAFSPALKYDEFVPVTTATYAGIDWGGWSSAIDNPETSFTVVSIGYWDKFGKLRVNYIEVVDEPDELKQADRVLYLLNKYHVRLAVADKGYGRIKNFKLLEKLGSNRFKTCKYLQGSASTLFKVQKEDTILVNRDFSLEELYSAMYYGKIAIPDVPQVQWVKEHFYAFEVEIVNDGKQVYKHFVAPKTKKGRTDAVHSLNFLRIAALFERKARDSSPIAKESRRRAPLPILTGADFDPTLYKHRDVIVPVMHKIKKRSV